MTLRTVHIGLGPIGRAILETVLERGWIPAAAVDADPALLGADPGALLGAPCELGLAIEAELPGAVDAQVALLATGSRLADVAPQIERCLAAGLHVVSTCEELAFPWRERAELARRIDRAAVAAGRVVLGAGINPGYLMDYLPLVGAGLCRTIERIEVRRIQDAACRRLPFQQKIGAGLTPEEFAARLAGPGSLGHVGLRQSIALLAHGLGWELDRVEEQIEPCLDQGRVSGVRQVALGFVGGCPRIRLEFVAALGQPDPHELLLIEGDPPVRMRLDPVHGDRSTAAIVANCAAVVARARPGLRTMADFAAAGGVPLRES